MRSVEVHLPLRVDGIRHAQRKEKKTKGGWLPQDRMQQTFQQHIYKMLQSINEHYEEMFICGVSLIQY